MTLKIQYRVQPDPLNGSTVFPAKIEHCMEPLSDSDLQGWEGSRIRDTVLVEPGSRQIFGSVSVSESRFLGILCSKDTFVL